MEDSFNSREHQFEAKFAHDEALKFKIMARRAKLLGAWVADQLGPAAPSHYVADFLEYSLGKTPAALVQKAQADLKSAGVTASEAQLREEFELFTDRAVAELKSV